MLYPHIIHSAAKFQSSQGIKQNHFKYSEIVRGHYYSVTCSSLVLFFAINLFLCSLAAGESNSEIVSSYLCGYVCVWGGGGGLNIFLYKGPAQYST